MVFDIMKLRSQTAFRCSQRAGQIVLQIANPGRVVEAVLNLPKDPQSPALTVTFISPILPFPFFLYPFPISLYPFPITRSPFFFERAHGPLPTAHYRRPTVSRGLPTAHCPLPTLSRCTRRCKQNLFMQMGGWIA